MAILTQAEIHTLRNAIISAKLDESREGLLATIETGFRASLPAATNPGEQVLRDLDNLNTTGTLADGSTPLLEWLKNAETLAGKRKEAAVFRTVIDRIGSGDASPPSPNEELGGPPIDRPGRYRGEHLVAALLLGVLVTGLAAFAVRGRGVSLDECRDSLSRLDTQSRLPGVTVDDLKNGIGGHVSRCRALLDGADAR